MRIINYLGITTEKIVGETYLIRKGEGKWKISKIETYEMKASPNIIVSI